MWSNFETLHIFLWLKNEITMHHEIVSIGREKNDKVKRLSLVLRSIAENLLSLDIWKRILQIVPPPHTSLEILD